MHREQLTKGGSKTKAPIVPFSLHRSASGRDGRENQADGPLEESLGTPSPAEGVIHKMRPVRSGVPLEADPMMRVTVADLLKQGAEKLAAVETPGGHCEVYRNEEGWLVILEVGGQFHRLIPCASRGDLLIALHQNLRCGPFAELSWKLVGKVF